MSDVDDGMSRAEIENSSGSCDEYVPLCSFDMKPYVGRKFQTIEDGIEFYKSYGQSTGFDVRLGQIKRAVDGTTIIRYVYCNREGVKNSASNVLNDEFEAKNNTRRRVSSRISCMARVIFRFAGSDGYVVDVFNEEHSHPLISDKYRHFMKCNRNLDYGHQNFILNCARANIGPMKSFRLFKELVGKYDRVGCSSVEFKNFTRDLRAYAVGVDAQILLNKFHTRREIFKEFTFDYCVDQSEKLTRLFWADSTSIRNYHVFGEAVSFDATYNTNRYNMIFAPFTGKDNHGRCVTFAAGLLSREDVESYSWILQKFMDCMKKKPNMIITDQDPALKIAVERVLPETSHRFCMWHIMLKVADKLPVSVRDSEDFAKRFNNIVWSEFIEPLDFELQWNDLLEEYDLLDDKWFDTMFELRNYWIPAFFKDFPMGGLFRTTSMSESENSFFRRYNNKNANLIEFFMHFESAIDAQRNAHDKCSSVDESGFPSLRTELAFERHAAAVYTMKVFVQVQEEITSASYVCCILNINMGPTITVYEIDDMVNGKFKVEHNIFDQSFICECKHFIKHGLLCRHIFLVFKNIRLQSIPDKYIVTRWTKYACSKLVGENNSVDSSSKNDKTFVMSQLYSALHSCLGMVEGNSDHMNDLLVDLRELQDKYKSVIGCSADASGKKKMFERFYGSAIPDVVTILPPDPVKTKGSGSRLKTRKEKALERLNKAKRKCSNCGKMVNHDKRNCDMVKSCE